jgi:ribosomal-protein-serine acetyltransferase
LESPVNELVYLIFLKDKFVGLIGTKDTDVGNKKTEIGYWLSENHQHSGIMTNSCKVLINYLFDELSINRIQLKAAAENYKSRNIAERLGFTQEGIEKEGELHKRGFVDLIVFGLLKKDWTNQSFRIKK